MRRILLALSLLFALSLFFIGCSEFTKPQNSDDTEEQQAFDLYNYRIENSSLAEYKTLFHDEADFKIDYPKNWNVRTVSELVPVLFVSPAADEADVFMENASVSIENLSTYPNEVTLMDYAALSEPQLTEGLKNYQILQRGARRLGGYEGYYFLGTHLIQSGVTTPENPDKVIQVLSLFVVEDKKAYVFTYSSDQQNPDAYTKEIQSMIDSFQLL